MTAGPRQIRNVVGVMTGTSIDGIDAALVRIDGCGLAMRASLIRNQSKPLGDLAPRLRAAAEQKSMTAGDFARLAWDFGQLHAETIAGLLADDRADLICVHGQTVFHQPPISWQLINPAPIARRFDCPVVFDLRQADLAAGGQGAPITPIADWILFADASKRRAIVNLGGFCNITILPKKGIEATRHQGIKSATASIPRCLDASMPPELNEIRGYDLCPCNHVLDAVARLVLKQSFDKDGAAAQAGIADPEAVNTLVTWMNRRRGNADGPKSFGTGDEAAEWVAHHSPRLRANDLAASAANAIGAYIAGELTLANVDEIILAGGGARNRALTQAIATIAKAPVCLSDELGVPIDARESICFAVLGALCADGVPITLPQATGAESAQLSGAWMGLSWPTIGAPGSSP